MKVTDEMVKAAVVARIQASYYTYDLEELARASLEAALALWEPEYEYGIRFDSVSDGRSYVTEASEATVRYFTATYPEQFTLVRRVRLSARDWEEVNA